MKTKEELQSKLQTDTLNIIGTRYNISVEIGTGGGKTLLGLKHMVQQPAHYKFLVVVQPISIFKDWINEYEIHGYKELKDRITFCSYRSLSKESLDYDWVYLDECHMITEEQVSWLQMYSMRGKILGLTGTYPQKGVKKDIVNKFFPLVHQYNIEEAIGSGMLNNYKIFIHMLYLSDKRNVIKKTKTGKIWYTSELKDYNYYNELVDDADNDFKRMQSRILRMKAIQSYPTKVEYCKSLLNKIGEKTLVFTTDKSQADEICKHSYHSSNKNSEENLKLFNEGKIYRLSAVEQISQGKNIKDLSTGIIMHCYSTDTKTKQKIGRFLRLSPSSVATIHILCYKNSIDLQWVKSALKSFNPTKIRVYDTKRAKQKI